MTAFIVRLIAYAVTLGIVSRVAQTMWSAAGLDQLPALHPFHDGGVTVLLVAPVALAVIGVRALRPLAIFVACFLAGAAVTAPIVCARAAGI